MGAHRRPAAAGPHCALRLERVSKHYGGALGVDSLDLVVARGEVVALIGPSGCGKSTTLRLIAGHERPEAGTIRIAGDVVADHHRFIRPERRRVGLMFQDQALFPHLNVARNVAFGLDQLSPAARRSRVAQLLDMVQLIGLADRYPYELSGGQQQRVALARALAPGPSILLLDEPFSGLDESLRAQVRRETLTVLRDTGTTAVLVTHNQAEALSVCDRVAVMRRGVIEQIDTPQEVFDHPSSRFVASFLGDPAFLPAQVHGGRVRCEIGAVPTIAGWGASTGDLEVVLRPHEVAIHPDPHASAKVSAVEYHGAFVLHHIRLASGRTVRCWQPNHTRHAIGTPVAVAIADSVTPSLLLGDTAVTCTSFQSPPVTSRRSG